MKITELKKGVEFDNYPTLCKELGVKPKGGTAKEAHLKNIQRYAELKFVGHKIIVTRKKRVAQRGIKLNSKEKTILLQSLLLNQAIENNSRKITVNEFKVATINKFNLVEDRYEYNRNDTSEMKNLLGLNETTILELKQLEEGSIFGKFETAIRGLRNLGALEYDFGLSIFCKDKSGKQYTLKNEARERMIQLYVIKKSKVMEDYGLTTTAILNKVGYEATKKKFYMDIIDAINKANDGSIINKNNTVVLICDTYTIYFNSNNMLNKIYDGLKDELKNVYISKDYTNTFKLQHYNDRLESSEKRAINRGYDKKQVVNYNKETAKFLTFMYGIDLF